MKRVSLVGMVMAVVCAGCTTKTDTGVVMGCFGVVNQNVPGTGVPNEVVTNLYFGGCSPADNTGMQILERVTQEASADSNEMNSLCDADCSNRVKAYASTHNVPSGLVSALSCQTLFASQCPTVEADLGTMSGDTGEFQAGGPADQRFLLTGNITVTINGQSSAPIPANGLVDASLGSCDSSGVNCAVTVSRLDVVSNGSFPLGGTLFDSAEVQNQGLGTGTRSATNMVVNGMELSVSAVEDGTPPTTVSFPVQTLALSENTPTGKPPLTLSQFFSSFTLTAPATQQNGFVQVVVTLNGVPAGSPPVASMTSTSTTNTFECTCAECTSLSFFSTATDPDNDLQSLAWVMDNNLELADGSAAPAELDLSMQMNFTNPVKPATNTHTMQLVATDTRGATSTATQTFKLQDTTAPVVTPPPDITLRSCDFPYIGQATATDVCDPNVVITSNQTTFQTGTNKVTWSAVDTSGNVGTAIQTVTIVAVSDPSVCCPSGYHKIFGASIGQSSDGKTHINGTTGNDCIVGTSNNDVIVGNGGNDIVFGIGGQDQITTGAGSDIIIAGTGTNDTITSGDGNDQIASGSANNTIIAGNGNDIIVGSPNVDTITAGNGNNIIYSLAGGDTIKVGNGTNYIDGGPDDDHITCGGGANTVVGGLGNDTITVGGGTDVLAAYQGDDHLNGGPGTDTFFGGTGHTACVSGGGTNTFVDCNN